MYKVRNNFRNPATIFENIVFIVCGIIFFLGTTFSFWAKSYTPAFELGALFLGSLIFLYHNNAVLVFVYDDEIVIRKFLRKHRFHINQTESVTYNVQKMNYEIIFDGKKFSVPVYFVNAKKFISNLKMASNYFATEKGIQRLKNYIKENACKPTYLLVPKRNVEPNIFSTKIGGVPYWDSSLQYPVDENGNKMHLLCQLNFSECVFKNELLPTEGMLQFFISSCDGLYGMNTAPEEGSAQKNFRIIFHKKINQSAKIEDIEKIVPQKSEIKSTPVLNPVALEFVQSISYMKANDYKMTDLIKSAVKEILNEDTDKDLYELLGDESENIYAYEIYRMITETENHILGYPSFIQGDVREDMSEEEASYFDTTLLHLDSSCCDGEAMCWGDVGEANFLINSSALKNKDFSKVLYTWDCY